MEPVVTRLPVNIEQINFHGWNIVYSKGVILRSICEKGIGQVCSKDDPKLCELCKYNYELELPHLPDMVFHKNKLVLHHESGAILEFVPIEALKLVENGQTPLQVACADEWKESRPDNLVQEKFKPFDWTYTSDYKGTNLNFRIEETKDSINKFKLMRREEILFYHDLTLYEDELHDNGISSCSVKIRVMPSGFYVLLRHFLRIDSVLLKIHDTRYHYEIEKNFILREYTKREATYDALKHVPSALFTVPNDIEGYLPIQIVENHKLFFK